MILVDKTDRYGTILKEGDKVEFLTSGKCKEKFGIIYKLSETQVLHNVNNRNKTHREFQNVRKVELGEYS